MPFNKDIAKLLKSTIRGNKDIKSTIPNSKDIKSTIFKMLIITNCQNSTNLLVLPLIEFITSLITVIYLIIVPFALVPVLILLVVLILLIILVLLILLVIAHALLHILTQVS